MKEYDDFLKGVKAFLKGYNFFKKGANFIRESENFYEVVNFQRSSSSTKDNALFTINVGVVSKKILDHRKFKFFNNLMHNQWQNRLSGLMGKGDLWVDVNKTVDIDALLKQVKRDLMHFILPALQQHSDEFYIVEKLWASIESGKILPFNTAEDLLILVAKSFPQRIEDAVSLLLSKIRDSNDRLFIAEIVRQLNING